MRKPVFITGEEAAAMIADNATVATIGMTLVSAAETILKAKMCIRDRFCAQSMWGQVSPVPAFPVGFSAVLTSVWRHARSSP